MEDSLAFWYHGKGYLWLDITSLPHHFTKIYPAGQDSRDKTTKRTRRIGMPAARSSTGKFYQMLSQKTIEYRSS